MKKRSAKTVSQLADEVFYQYHRKDSIDEINKKLSLQNRDFIYL
jgi:hypothetical protein